MLQRRKGNPMGSALTAWTVAVMLFCSGCAASAGPDPAPETGAASGHQSSDSATSAPVAGAPASLDDDIAEILEAAGDIRVGVAVADVSGGATRTFGDESVFVAASTSKIITAAAFYDLVARGEASLDDPLGDSDAAFQIQEMVNSSDNDAWMLLMQEIGYPQLTDYAGSIGVVYDPEENVLAATDMAQVLKMLHAGDLLNEADTEQLLGYMQGTINEELIPAASGPGVTVHHKYGQLDPFLHDAALISFGESTSVLVIFTERTGQVGEPDQIKLIHDLTRAVEGAINVPIS